MAIIDPFNVYKRQLAAAAADTEASTDAGTGDLVPEEEKRSKDPAIKAWKELVTGVKDIDPERAALIGGAVTGAVGSGVNYATRQTPTVDMSASEATSLAKANARNLGGGLGTSIGSLVGGPLGGAIGGAIGTGIGQLTGHVDEDILTGIKHRKTRNRMMVSSMEQLAEDQRRRQAIEEGSVYQDSLARLNVPRLF